MNSTFITFSDNYYRYKGLGTDGKRCLSIGGYESAWLADLVIAYILENCESHFNDLHYSGIYRDDGLLIFPGVQTSHSVNQWLQEFQTLVDSLVGTCANIKLWQNSGNLVFHHPCPTFPYLDMEMSWNDCGQLSFNIHLKPNQQLLYVNLPASTQDRALKPYIREWSNAFAA